MRVAYVAIVFLNQMLLYLLYIKLLADVAGHLPNK